MCYSSKYLIIDENRIVANTLFRWSPGTFHLVVCFCESSVGMIKIMYEPVYLWYCTKVLYAFFSFSFRFFILSFKHLLRISNGGRNHY